MQPSGESAAMSGSFGVKTVGAVTQRLQSYADQHAVQYNRSRTHGEKLSDRGGYEEKRWTLRDVSTAPLYYGRSSCLLTAA